MEYGKSYSERASWMNQRASVSKDRLPQGLMLHDHAPTGMAIEAWGIPHVSQHLSRFVFDHHMMCAIFF